MTVSDVVEERTADTVIGQLVEELGGSLGVLLIAGQPHRDVDRAGRGRAPDPGLARIPHRDRRAAGA
jgi:hypothetical protein